MEEVCVCMCDQKNLQKKFDVDVSKAVQYREPKGTELIKSSRTDGKTARCVVTTVGSELQLHDYGP